MYSAGTSRQVLVSGSAPNDADPLFCSESLGILAPGYKELLAQLRKSAFHPRFMIKVYGSRLVVLLRPEQGLKFFHSMNDDLSKGRNQ